MTTESHNQPAESFATVTVDGELSAKYTKCVDRVVAELGEAKLFLTPTDAARLALALLRGAAKGGADVFEYVRDAAEELTHAADLAHELLDGIEGAEFARKVDLVMEHTDLTEDEAMAVVEEGESGPAQPVLSWQEYLAKVSS